MPQLRDCARLTMRRGSKFDLQSLDRLISFGIDSGLLLTLDQFLNRGIRILKRRPWGKVTVTGIDEKG